MAAKFPLSFAPKNPAFVDKDKRQFDVKTNLHFVAKEGKLGQFKQLENEAIIAQYLTKGQLNCQLRDSLFQLCNNEASC